MAVRHIPLKALLVNRANDRHGELENETAAIAWLFNTREVHKARAQERHVQRLPRRPAPEAARRCTSPSFLGRGSERPGTRRARGHKPPRREAAGAGCCGRKDYRGMSRQPCRPHGVGQRQALRMPVRVPAAI
jgi:hypothetical protein